MADGLTGRPYAPAAENILSGGQVVIGSNTSTSFLTIPAGRTWRGTISVCAANGVTTAVDATAANTQVVTAGAGVTPAAGTILAVAISKRDTAPGVATQQDVYVAAPTGNAVTLNILNSTTATTYAGAASATGYLL